MSVMSFEVAHQSVRCNSSSAVRSRMEKKLWYKTNEMTRLSCRHSIMSEAGHGFQSIIEHDICASYSHYPSLDRL